MALRAGTVLAEGDPTRWLPPGAVSRTDYVAPLPTTNDGSLAGTSATGLARAIEGISEGELAVLPVAGPWTADSVVDLVEISSATPGCVLLANGRTGHLWGSRPSLHLLLGHLLGASGSAPAPDWDVGHFLQILAAAWGPSGTLVALHDTYPGLGWDGHHLQPAGTLAAALERGDGAESGVLILCQTPGTGTLRERLEAAGFELRQWDNGNPDSERRGA